MSDPRFIHLRLHTEYSLLEGAMRLKKLPGLVAGMGMPAVAVTDTNNLFCALEFSVGAQGAGVQPRRGLKCATPGGRSMASEAMRPLLPARSFLSHARDSLATQRAWCEFRAREHTLS